MPHQRAPLMQAPAPRPSTPGSSRGAPAWASWAIVIGAVVIAIAIVGAGFWYRSLLHRPQTTVQPLPPG
jgi:hypothetical protein